MPDVPWESLWPKSILCYDVSLPTAVENLAFDEAILNAVDSDSSLACVRFWQPTDYFVVLGRSNKPETEVDLDYCLANKIPVYRRATGGGAVLVGPGCLCYSLALPITDTHRLLGVSRVTADLMSRTAAGLSVNFPEVQVCGTSDLVLNGLKFSGNAQRWLRQSLIHHGTLLFDFELSLIENCLRHPTREPSYRNLRRHNEFVMNLAISSFDLQRCLCAAWNAIPTECPAAAMEAASRIAVSRYTSADWKISM